MHDRMIAMGLSAPSIASLGRIFRETGVARLEPRKKPRAAFRRFVYPAPNACWQLDATEYVLAGGRTCVIFQLEDDHSRVEVASHVADGETAADALIVFRKGVAARGVPQRLLTDNGVALNPSRRGVIGQLVAHAQSLGVETITGKPYKPTTQGKNERLHQTLFRWLDKQPMAGSIHELQALVDQFDIIYNTERGHQGLPGRVTPQQAWDATPVAEPPRRRPVSPLPVRKYPTGEAIRRIGAKGLLRVTGVEFMIGKAHTGALVHVIWDPDTLTVFDEHGTEITTIPRPPQGVKAVGNGQPRGFMARHQLSPMS